MDIAQKPNKSGQILDQCWKIFFIIFTKSIPRRVFFCIAKILVLMVLYLAYLYGDIVLVTFIVRFRTVAARWLSLRACLQPDKARKL